MTTAWPMVKLGEVLTHYQEYIEAPKLRIYPKLSVKLYGKGVVLDAPADGTALKMKRHQIAKTGQVILSEIWGKKGAIGFVPPEGDGALCTSHFFLFDVRDNKLNRRWLQAIFDANYLEEQLGAEAKGTTGYAAVRPKDLLNCEIPLPPLPEQCRIVVQIEELTAQIEEARALRREAIEEAMVLLSRATAAVLDDQPWPRLQLGNLLSENPRNGLGPQPEAEDGRVMLRINAVSSAPTRFVDMTAAKKVTVSDDAARLFVIQDNDIFIVRFNGDIHRVAKAAIYKGRNEASAVYPDKLIRLRPDPAKMMPDFLVYALGSWVVRDQIESLGRTTAGNIGISGSDVKSFVVPVPPLSQQSRIVVGLDALQAEVDRLKQLQAETATQLDALLPSVLDQAFRGEL